MKTMRSLSMAMLFALLALTAGLASGQSFDTDNPATVAGSQPEVCNNECVVVEPITNKGPAEALQNAGLRENLAINPYLFPQMIDSKGIEYGTRKIMPAKGLWYMRRELVGTKPNMALVHKCWDEERGTATSPNTAGYRAPIIDASYNTNPAPATPRVVADKTSPTLIIADEKLAATGLLLLNCADPKFSVTCEEYKRQAQNREQLIADSNKFLARLVNLLTAALVVVTAIFILLILMWLDLRRQRHHTSNTSHTSAETAIKEPAPIADIPIAVPAGEQGGIKKIQVAPVRKLTAPAVSTPPPASKTKVQPISLGVKLRDENDLFVALKIVKVEPFPGEIWKNTPKPLGQDLKWDDFDSLLRVDLERIQGIGNGFALENFRGFQPETEKQLDHSACGKPVLIACKAMFQDSVRRRIKNFLNSNATALAYASMGKAIDWDRQTWVIYIVGCRCINAAHQLPKPVWVPAAKTPVLELAGAAQ
jgi:hypothetical protein